MWGGRQHLWAAPPTTGTGPARQGWSCLRPAAEGAHSRWPPWQEARGRTTQLRCAASGLAGLGRPRASAGRHGRGETPRGSFRERRADVPPATAQREVTGGKGHWSQEGVPTPEPSGAEEASVLSVTASTPTPMCLPAGGELHHGPRALQRQARGLVSSLILRQGTAGSVVLSGRQYGGHRTPRRSPPGLHGNSDGGMHRTRSRPQCQAPVFCVPRA